MNYLLFYYLITRVIMVFILLFGYTGQTRRTNGTTLIYSRAILASLIPIFGELLFSQIIIATLLGLL